MSKSIKPSKPETIELCTNNTVQFYADLEKHILDGYTIVKDGYAAPCTFGYLLTATLILATR